MDDICTALLPDGSLLYYKVGHVDGGIHMFAVVEGEEMIVTEIADIVETQTDFPITFIRVEN